MSDHSETLSIVLGIVLAGAASFAAWYFVLGDHNGDSGGLEQKPGKAACVSVDGSGGFSESSADGDCAVARAIAVPTALVLSGDGRNAYVAAHREAVAVLDRDPRNGVLAAKTGRTGCISRDGTPGGERGRRLRHPEISRDGSCAIGRGLFGATSLALSPDGRNVYVGSADGLAIFDRDRTGGGLTQKPGQAGCVSRTGSQRGATTRTNSCASARGLLQVSSLTVSPDGRNLYVTSVDTLAFKRDPRTGALTQLEGRAGCVAATRRGEGGTNCVADPEIDGATSIVVTPDGRQVYASSGADTAGAGAVAILDRDRRSGALARTPGRAGCIARSDACTGARGLRGAETVAFSADGANAYVVSFLGCTLAVFDRGRPGRPPIQKPGVAGTATDHGASGACRNRSARDPSGFTGGGVAPSPDGRTLFVTTGAGVAMYARSPRGGLSYKGCVSDDGEGTCEDVKVLNVPIAPAVSRDGRNLYVAVQRGDAIAAFDVPRPSRGG